MGRTLRSGRSLGVEIVLDRTWPPTFVLATATKPTRAPHSEPLLPLPRTAALVSLGAAAAIGLFASLALPAAARPRDELDRKWVRAHRPVAVAA